jgi:DNA repair photolyase
VPWKNPFNGTTMYVSFSKARLIVFWSKNPEPIIQHVDFFDKTIKNYYFQFTLNDYDKEKLEPNVPPVAKRLETFIKLSEKIGKQKVIWRFDPLILTDNIGVDELLRKVENIGNQLKGYTEKLVFSFADIKLYKKVVKNLNNSAIKYREFDTETMHEFAAGLQKLNQLWNYKIGTCAEKIPLENFGIEHNKCIDDDLIARLFSHDTTLMNYLGIKIIPATLFDSKPEFEFTKNNKDKGQRELCGCIISKDIGQYNTCPHLCEYCYANNMNIKTRTMD